jgi:hypothetical protein
MPAIEMALGAGRTGRGIKLIKASRLNHSSAHATNREPAINPPTAPKSSIAVMAAPLGAQEANDSGTVVAFLPLSAN